MSKGRVIILMFPERGALNASFMLAKALIGSGFAVEYLVNDRYLPYVRQQGFAATMFDLDPFYNHLNALLKRIKSQKRFFLLKFWLVLKLIRSRNDRLEKYLDESLAKVFDEPVDLLLMDPILMNCSIPFLKRSVRIAHLNTTFAYRCNITTPPVFSGYMPQRVSSAAYSLNVVFRWIGLFLKVIYKDVRWNLKYGLVPTRTFNTARKKIALYGPGYAWTEYGFRVRCPEMILAPRELDFDHIADATSRCYVGACIDENRSDGIWDIETHGRSVLYCSLGTYNYYCPHARKLFESVITFIKDFPDWLAIVQVGDLAFGENQVPDNVIIANMLPQLKVLQMADIAITHGGCSSLKECAFTGTPMIVVPWNNDGFGNAARARYHDLGVIVDIETVSPETMRDAFLNVKSNRRIKESAHRMQEVLQQQVECLAGVEFVNKKLVPTKMNYNTLCRQQEPLVG